MTTDISAHTQMIIVLLYVLKKYLSVLENSLFQKNQTADGISKHILEQLILQGTGQKLITQTFNDVNVMKDKKRRS